MIKIRLMRIGAKQKPFYRIVVVDERSKRTGAYIELLGTYNPLTNPHDIKLNKDRVDYWLKQGAQKSDGFLRILGEAPQKPPRKPKKSVRATGDSGQVKTVETKIEEKAEESVVQEAATESTPTEEAKSRSTEAIGEVERTSEVDEPTQEQGAKQTNSEPTEEASGASQPDEPTSETATETESEEQKQKNERSA